MDNAEVDQLRNEQLIGNKAQSAYDQFIQEFIAEKRALLFDAFNDLPLSAEEDLFEVKRMLYAINALDIEIMGIIDTGKLASQALNDNEGLH